MTMNLLARLLTLERRTPPRGAALRVSREAPDGTITEERIEYAGAVFDSLESFYARYPDGMIARHLILSLPRDHGCGRHE